MTGTLERMRAIATDPVSAAREAKSRTGRPVIAAVSSWAPDPLVIAAGGIPLRLPAGVEGRQQGTRAGAHFQTSSCFFCRSVLEMGLGGELDFVDALFLVQSCDTQQNLSDIWKVAVPSIPVVDVYMPVNRLSEAAGPYLVREIEMAATRLGAIAGTEVDADSLGLALKARDGVEGLLGDLYEARLASTGRVPALDHYAACICSSCLPPDESGPLLEAAVGGVRSGDLVAGRTDGGTGAACVMAGSVIPYPGIFGLLDRLDVAVRDDDLSMGRRLFDHGVPADGSPIERIARSLLARSTGAVKHDTGMRRGQRLVELAARAGVKHVILPLLKFCDPWAWDTPALRSRLAAEGIGMLHLELAGDEDPGAGPVLGRVEAYFEMDRVGDLFDV